ncbi:MAG: response regulator [Pseudomonadota bacterium]
MIRTVSQISPRNLAHCLIIEDSAFDSQKMSRVVDKVVKGCPVRVATSLREARKMLSEAAPAFILLDNNLPDGKGADFARELAANARLAHIPVVLISDWPSPFMWEKAASAGVLHVVDKSDFDARYVHAAVRTARERRGRLN